MQGALQSSPTFLGMGLPQPLILLKGLGLRENKLCVALKKEVDL